MAEITIGRSAASKAREADEARQKAMLHVNAEVGEKRRKYLTDIPGQQLIYQAKEAEARAYQANGQVGPYMAAEVGITTMTPAELANLWISKAEEWRRVAPQLEQLRLGTLGDLKSAATAQEVATLLAEFDSIMENL